MFLLLLVLMANMKIETRKNNTAHISMFILFFRWMEKLGISAKYGLRTVFRQTIYGGYYSMIGKDLQPNPVGDVFAYLILIYISV